MARSKIRAQQPANDAAPDAKPRLADKAYQAILQGLFDRTIPAGVELSQGWLAEKLGLTVRWFDDRYTISTDWPDECYVNHAFEPNGLWHLGFIFAADDLPRGAEITVDYRHLLAPGQEESFRDAHSGRAIVGWSWHESLSRSTAQLQTLLARSGVREPVPA